MPSFPKLSYVCPIPWAEMRGDEKERFCSKCARTVVNLSLLTETQRAALLAQSKPEELCVSYYRRLSGEFVSAEHPLTAPESRRVVQYGLVALSVGAAALALNLVPGASEAVVRAHRQLADNIANVESAVSEHTSEFVSKVTGHPLPLKPKPAPVMMIMGMIACPPPIPVTPPTPVEVPSVDASSEPKTESTQRS